MTNLVAATIYSDNGIDNPEEFTQVQLDFSPYTSLADEPEALVDEIDLVFFADEMSDATRSVLLEAVEVVPPGSHLERARLALYLALISPGYAVVGADQ